MKISWKIEKMKCEGCIERIVQSLLLIEGISDVEVDLESKTVNFNSTDNYAAESAKKALLKAGFPPNY